MLKDPGLAETTYSKIRGCLGAFHNITTPYFLPFHVEELLERDNCRRDWERLKERAALRPVSASNQVFSFINKSRIPGPGSWIEDKLRMWWQGTQPLPASSLVS
jgi:hypothetical protein